MVNTQKIYKARPYQKGQIWLVEEPEDLTAAKIRSGFHTMAKTRPYVIYGQVENRFENTMLQAFPCTSNTKLMSVDTRTMTGEGHDGDLFFETSQGKISKIVTNQLTTIDSNQLTRYFGVIPPELIDELDRIVIESFGLGDKFVQMSREVKRLKDELELIQDEAGSLFSAFNYKECSGHLVPVSVHGDVDDDFMVDAHITITRTKSGRIRWNNDLMQLFLNQLEKIPRDQICEIWGVSPKQLYPMKQYCLHKLGGGGINLGLPFILINRHTGPNS